jgi:hypothetical protein
MICRKCSNVCSEGQVFCAKCGTPLAPDSGALRPSVAPVPTSSKKPSIWPKLALGFLLLCIGSMFSTGLPPLGAAFVALLMVGGVAYLFSKKLGPKKLRQIAAIVAAGSVLGVVSSYARTDRLQREREAQQASAEQAERERQEQLARVPGLMEAVRAGAARADWEPAAAAYEALQKIDPGSASQLAAEASQVQSALAREQQERQLAARKQEVATAIADARKLVADKGLCDTPLAIKNVWTVFRTLTPADPEYADAKAITPKLEACRAKTGKALSKGVMDLMQQQRVGIRSKLDQHFLENNLDVDVSVSGADKDQITLRNVLFGNRAFVHKMTAEGDILQTLQKVGFQRVTFSNGFGKSQHFDLEPDREDNAGDKVLGDMGLGEPLKL